jgi:hypothetical protein
MMDDDEINMQRRKMVYRHKKEMLGKIATLSKEATLTILSE